MNTIKLSPNYTSVWWGLLLLLILGCEKTNVIEYDAGGAISLSTQAISIKSSKELHLKGEVKHLNKEEILDIGFIVYELGQSINNPKEISLGKAKAKTGNIEYLYRSPNAFQIGKDYGYCIYIKTNKGYYKGQLINFNIDLINTDPDKIHKVLAGSTFNLSGDYSQLNPNTTLTIHTKEYFNKKIIKLSYQVAADAKSINVQIPSLDVYHGGQYEIILNSQDKNGENSYKRVWSTIQVLAKLDTPTINEIFYNDDLPISGFALPYDNPTDLKIIVAGKPLPYFFGMKLSDFGPFDQASLKWSYDNGSGIKDFPEHLIIKAPKGDEFNLEQSILHPFQRLVFRTKDLKRYFGDTIKKISIGDQVIKDIEITDWGFSIDRLALTPGTYEIIISSSTFDVKLPTILQIKHFDMTSLSKTEIYPFEEFTIKGSFIKGEYYKIKPGFSDYTSVTAESETELKYRLEYLFPNVKEFELSLDRVEERNQSTVKNLPLKLLNPVLTGLSSKTVNIGNTFILKGKGLLAINAIYAGKYSPTFIRHTNEEIEIRIPYYFMSGKYPITLVTMNLIDNELKTDQIFEVL